MGGVVDAVGGLFGVGGSESVTPLQYRPFDVRSALGEATVDGRQVNAQLSPELQGIYSGLLGQVPQQLQAAATPEASLGFLSRAFAPQFERQQLSQESRLFNQGLLGTTAGGLQTQALREAQNQALVQNALSAQQQAFQRGQGLLGSALQLGAAPLGLAELGGAFGARELQAQEGTQALRQQAEDRQASFFSSLVGAGATAFGGFNQGGGDIASRTIAEGGSAAPPPSVRRNQGFFSFLPF